MSCQCFPQAFPPMRMQIDVWAVSNLTFVLLSFTILNLTTKVPFKVLALYSLRYGTLKHGNGEAMPYTTFRSHKNLLCSVTLFVGPYNVCSQLNINDDMMQLLPLSCIAIWFSYGTCEMSALSFQVFLFESELWATTTHLRTRRDRSGAPHANLGYHIVIVWVVWKNYFFFRMAFRHDCNV